MKMLEGQLSILLIVYIHSSLCALNAVYDTGKEIWKLYPMIDNMISTTSNSAFNLYKNQVDDIHEKLQRIENSNDSKNISDSFKSWPYPITLYKSLETLEIFIQAVDQYYDYFRQQIREISYYADYLRYFMTPIIPHIEEKIRTIRSKVLAQNELLRENLISAIAGHAVSEQPHLCNSPRIISEVLVQLFKMIVVAEMKAHVMLATAEGYQHLADNDSGWLNYLSRERLEIQIGLYVNLFSSNIQTTDPIYLRACEPFNDHWIRDQSFYELEGTFQTAIFRYRRENCSVDNCHDIWFKKSRKCDAQYYDDRSGCSGEITKCTALNAIQACVLENGPYKFYNVNSTRQGSFGSTLECPSVGSYIIEDGSGPNSSHSACACTCNGNENKISLSIMESNVKSNMVITGVRFIRQDRILYIQPREGKLYADGRIRHYSERWIPIPKNIPSSQLHIINRQNRAFFLDSLRLPSDFVLTGVKFNRVQKTSLISGFAIEIFGVPFNFNNGKLNSDPNFSMSKQASDNNLGEPLIFDAINPASSTLPLKLTPDNTKYVLLKRSSLRSDFGQSTLPLFDAVPVMSHPSLPLGGLGIFHKGTDDDAGFISLRVLGIKYQQYFTDFQGTHMKNDRLSFNETQ